MQALADLNRRILRNTQAADHEQVGRLRFGSSRMESLP
jgi:hypothetical protein